MATCKIRSYNAVRAEIFGKKPTMVDRIILLRSKPHTHSEFQFSERYNKLSHSATMAEGAKQARFKRIKYSHEAERWDTVLVPLSDAQEDLAYQEAVGLNGVPYDLIGQLSHLTGFKIWKPSKNKIWCSKDVSRLLYASTPSFFDFLSLFGLTEELRPDQLDMMARYFWGPK